MNDNKNLVGNISYGSLSLISSIPGPLRCTSKSLEFWSFQRGLLFNTRIELPPYRLNKLISESPKETVDKGQLDEPMTLIEYSDILKGFGSILHPEKVNIVGSNKVVLPPNTFVYGKLDPDSGRIFISPENETVIASSDFVPISVNTELVIPEFLLYLMLLPEICWVLSMLKAGKCHQRASTDKLLACKVPLPPIEEQCSFLSTIRPAINEIKKLAKNIPSYQEIVDNGFEDYIHGNIPPTLKVKLSSPDVFAKNRLLRLGYRILSMEYVFQDMLKQYNSLISFNTIIKVRGGKRLSTGTIYSQDPTGYRYLRGNDIGKGMINEEEVVSISKSDYEHISKFAAQENDIALTIAGVVGKSAIIRNFGHLGVTENIALIRPINSDEYCPDFIMYLLQTSFMQFQMNKEMSELRQQKLSLEKVRALRLPSPPSIQIQKKLLKKVQTGFEREQEILRDIVSAKKRIDESYRSFLGIIPNSYVTSIDSDANELNSELS